MTFKIRQNAFSSRAAPQTPRGKLTTLPRFPSRLGRGHPGPLPISTPLGVFGTSILPGGIAPKYFPLEPRVSRTSCGSGLKRGQEKPVTIGLKCGPARPAKPGLTACIGFVPSVTGQTGQFTREARPVSVFYILAQSQP